MSRLFLIAGSATPISASLPPDLNNKYSPQLEGKPICRRNAVVLLSLLAPLLPSLRHPPAASAFSLGISGPKQWLQEQKKKSAKFLLAPVSASRNSLQTAHHLLVNRNGGSEFDENGLEEVQILLKSAARDCVLQDRNRFVQFQSRAGVEVCTFRLILKNASSLLDDKDPLKMDAESKLTDLISFIHTSWQRIHAFDDCSCKMYSVYDVGLLFYITQCVRRCFASLNGMASELDVQVASNRQKIADALVVTISSLNIFEQKILPWSLIT
ncbi:hypothetical protein DM860_006547 [Cuscuta australis]|uniref:Uncharacterized protein n=1 Tax=Cuscuta australis TaxID=267555 RepID=A0A328D3U9_9ASTE|nr:hypothetical protein DM860_006547 [Cuscuta australis]